MLKQLQDRRAEHVEAIKAELRATVEWASRELRSIENNPKNLPGTLSFIAKMRNVDRHTHAARTIDDAINLVETGRWPERT